MARLDGKVVLVTGAASGMGRVATRMFAEQGANVVAADLNERKRTNLSNLKFKREDRWANYIKAEIAAFAERSSVRGFNITVAGDVPQGLGLGSATALQCAAA